MNNAAGLTATLTLTGSGTGTSYTFSNAINENSTTPGSLTLVVDMSGTGTVGLSSANSTYAGGTVIRRGSVTVAGTQSLGTGAVLIGDTTGSGNATLTLNAAGSFANNMTVQAGSSGTATIRNTSTSNIPVIGGTLTLNKDTVFDVVTNGTTAVANTILGTGNISLLNGGTLAMGNGGTTGALAAGTTVSGTGLLGFNRSDNVVLSNNITGAAGIHQLGTGTLTLNGTAGGVHAGTGATRVSNGTMVLDFTNALSATDMVSATGILTLGSSAAGGHLSLIGAASTANSQTVGSTTFATSVDNNVTLNAGDSGGTLVLSLGAVTRSAGAFVNFNVDAGSSINSTTGTANTIWLSSGAIVIGAFGNDWAARAASGTGVVAGSTLGGFYTNSGASSLAGNADVAAGVDTALGANASITSLRFNQNEARTVDLGSSILTLSSGGLMIGSNVATAGSKIIGGQLRGSTGSSKELVVVQNSAQSFEIGSTITDNTAAVAFSKHGAGTLVLSGNNTWTGQTYIAAGTLQIGAGGTTGTLGGAAAVTNMGVLAVNRSDTLSISNAISGAGRIEILGGGTVTFSVANSYAGGTTVKNGTVQVASNTGALGAAPVTLGDSAGGSNNASLIQITTGLNVANAIVLAPNTTGTLTVGNTTAGIATTTYSGTITGANNLTLANQGTGSFALSMTGTINNAGGINVIGASTGATGLSNSIGANVTGITMSSSGALILSGVNSAFGGPVNLATGTLRVNSATALGGNGSATGTGGALTISGGTALENTSGGTLTLTTVNAVNVNGSFTFSSPNSLTFATGAWTMGSPNITMTGTGAGTLNAAGAIGGTTNLTLSGTSGGYNFSGNANFIGTLSTTGAGTGAVTFSGGVTSNVTNINHASAGNFSISGAGASVRNNGSITLNGSGSGTASLSATTINPSGLITNQGLTTGTTTISGAVGANVQGIIQNSPTSILNFSSGTVGQIGTVGGYTNGIWIKQGVVYLSTSAAGNVNPISGAGTVTMGDTGGSGVAVLESRNGTSAPNVNNSILIKEGSTGDKVLRYDSTSGGTTMSGSMTFENNPSIDVPMNVVFRKLATGGGSLVYNGPISGNGSLTFENVASSTLTIGGNNSGFAGTMNFNLGTTGVSASNSVNANVLVNIASGATMSISAASATYTIEGLTGSGQVLMPSGSTRTLAISGASGTNTFSGAINIGGNTLNLTKNNGSTQILSGTLNHNGTTAINGGTLLINGTHNGTAGYSVNSGGTLGGTGTINTTLANGVAVVSGGKLSPGASPGTLTLNLGATGVLNVTGAVTASNSQALIYELTTPGDSDKVAVTNSGAVTAVNIGTGVLEFDDFAFTNGIIENGDYTLIDSNAAITGTLGANLSGALNVFQTGTLSLAESSNDLVLTVVPEPGSLSLLAIGATSLLRRRRRK